MRMSVFGVLWTLASQAGSDPAQFGRSDDRPAATLDTHHDLAKNEVTGKVVKADPNAVWIDHMGAVIVLKLDPNTRFESADVTRAKDLKEGQEIRASFTVHNKTTNVADSISLEGSGARPNPSGLDAHRTATSPQKPVTLPEDKSTDPGAHPNDAK
ncbi:MAG TPA: hypothetical protein VKB87_06520 [Myxococcaceae bacterium]|nr:hypothetical protein [Myxococcaceae bacterium]